MQGTEQVDHNREVITLGTATIEQCKALIIACESRIEQVKRETSTQLRLNLKQMANAAGLPLKSYLRQLLEVEEGRAEAPAAKRSRRPTDEVSAEREAGAKRSKYYDPVSKTGWNGYGRAPRIFHDRATGMINRAFLESCRNPDFQEWQRAEDAAE